MISKRELQKNVIKQFRRVGWNTESSSQIKKNVSVTLEEKGILIDYLLLNSSKKPLALVVIKNENINTLDSKMELIMAAKKLNVYYIFIVIGNLIYIWDIKNDDARIISSIYSQFDLERLVKINSYQDNSKEIQPFISFPENSTYARDIHDEVMKEFEQAVYQGKTQFSLHIINGLGKFSLMMKLINKLSQNGRLFRTLILVDDLQQLYMISDFLENYIETPDSLFVIKGKNEFEQNFNPINNKLLPEKMVVLSPLHSFSPDISADVSPGLFDLVIVYDNSRLYTIDYLKRMLNLNAFYINFLPFPIIDDKNKQYNLDFSFDLQRALEQKHCLSIDILSMNKTPVDIPIMDPKDLNILSTFSDIICSSPEFLKAVVKSFMENIKLKEHIVEQKSLIIAQNVRQAQLLEKYLNEELKISGQSYAKAITAISPSKTNNRNIAKFRNEIYPQVLISVSMLENKNYSIRNVKNIVILKHYKNPISLYNLISNYTILGPYKNHLTIYDYSNNSEMMNGLYNRGYLNKKVRPYLDQKKSWIINSEITTQTTLIDYEGKRISDKKYILKWEKFIRDFFQVNKHSVINIEELCSSLKREDIEIIGNKFNEETLQRAYNDINLSLKDFIVSTLNGKFKKIRLDYYNKNFYTWINSKNFTDPQIYYLNLLKDISIEYEEVQIQHLKINKNLSYLNISGLGRELFGDKELEYILVELNDNVFTIL
ncbi:hypothetical protein C1N73_32600 (plasmid) [Priestia aryabhattai]